MGIDLTSFAIDTTELNTIRLAILGALVGVFLWRKVVKTTNKS